MDDEYDNHSIRPIQEQLASLQKESVNSIVDAIKFHISVSRMLKKESPEKYEESKKFITLSVQNMISDPTVRVILLSVLFDLV